MNIKWERKADEGKKRGKKKGEKKGKFQKTDIIKAVEFQKNC
jgi:hypothetical protein